MNEPLRQAYDEQGRPIPGKGYTKAEAFTGLLHAVSHIWVWRGRGDSAEVLVQKRSEIKPSWPGKLDVSAAGHIDLGETPMQAAIREAKEEIGLNTTEQQLFSLGVYRCYLVTDIGLIENEFQHLYAFELRDEVTFTLQDEEVGSLLWRPFSAFKKEVFDDPHYVEHGELYYGIIVENLERIMAGSR